jgi:hypothetical protein
MKTHQNEQAHQEEKEFLLLKVIEWAQKQKRDVRTLTKAEILEAITHK